MSRFEDLVGLTLKNVIVTRNNIREDDSIVFITDTDRFVMRHYQNCCESVTIEDIIGDISDLLNTPIILAYEYSIGSDGNDPESYTYTFYNISTVNGSVTICWYGTSNGYYSESVYFYKEN